VREPHSSGGMQLISGSEDCTFKSYGCFAFTNLLVPFTPMPVAIFSPLKEHEDWVMLVAFSPDGTKVLSGSLDCAIQIYDVVSCIYGP
jgi:WD40 repeat protein